MSELNVERSLALWRRAQRVIPGGGVTESKRPTSLFAGEAFPAYFREARGATIVDVDGNEYVDYCLGLGPILLGYGHPEVNAAIAEQLERGFLASLCHEKVVILAERLVALVPSAEMVRLMKTGAEAAAAALRVARAFTGREKVLTCGYHGWHDWCSRGRGVPAGVAGYSHPFELDDLSSFGRLFDEHGGDLACVVLEPVQDEEPSAEFLTEVRRRCRHEGVVLVFDEIKTGFRMARGGAQERYGVVPDLTVLGKGMANGMPLAALVGRREVMEVLEEVWVSSTYAGEVLSVAASLAVLEVLEREPVVEHLWRLGGRLLEGFARIAARYPRMLRAGGTPPMSFLRFRPEIADREELERHFFRETLRGGVLLKRTAYNFICYSHTEAQIDRTLEVTEAAAEKVWSGAC